MFCVFAFQCMTLLKTTLLIMTRHSSTTRFTMNLISFAASTTCKKFTLIYLVIVLLYYILLGLLNRFMPVLCTVLYILQIHYIHCKYKRLKIALKRKLNL